MVGIAKVDGQKIAGSVGGKRSPRGLDQPSPNSWLETRTGVVGSHGLSVRYAPALTKAVSQEDWGTLPPAQGLPRSANANALNLQQRAEFFDLRGDMARADGAMMGGALRVPF